MSKRGKVLAAFSVSPLAAAVPVIVYSLSLVPSQGVGAALEVLLVTSAIVIVCGYVAILVLGIPTYLIYRSKGVESVWAYLTGSILIGIVVSALVTAAFSYGAKYPAWGLVLFSGVAAACAGLVFWWLVKSPPNHRLERDI